MPRSHWEFHVQQAIDEYSVDGDIQRIGSKFLVLLSAITEIVSDENVVSTIDSALAGVRGSPQALADRNLMRLWLVNAKRPAHLFSFLEQEIRENR